MAKTRDARVKNSLGNDESVPFPGAGSTELACRHLDDGEAPEGADDAPRRHGQPGLHHAPVPSGDEDVDGKTHEKRVHHVRGGDDERVTGLEPLAAEQAALARGRIEGPFEHCRNRQPRALVQQPARDGCTPQQRPQEVVLQNVPGGYGMPDRMMGMRMRYLTG